MKTFKQYMEMEGFPDDHVLGGNPTKPNQTMAWTPQNQLKSISPSDEEDFKKIASGWRQPGDWRISVEDRLKELRTALASHKAAIKTLQSKIINPNLRISA
jgi:hypothetical protein